MSAINQVSLEAHICNGYDHTYKNLCYDYSLAEGSVGAMQIDRTLQKLRRNGLIAYRRVGRVIIWKVK